MIGQTAAVYLICPWRPLFTSLFLKEEPPAFYSWVKAADYHKKVLDIHFNNPAQASCYPAGGQCRIGCMQMEPFQLTLRLPGGGR